MTGRVMMMRPIEYTGDDTRFHHVIRTEHLKLFGGTYQKTWVADCEALHRHVGWICLETGEYRLTDKALTSFALAHKVVR